MTVKEAILEEKLIEKKIAVPCSNSSRRKITIS